MQNDHELSPSKKKRETGRKDQFWDLFIDVRTTFVFLTQCYGWLVSLTSYFCMMYGVENIHGNVYLNSAILSICDLSSFLAYLAMNKFGRKPTFIFGALASILMLTSLLFSGELFPGGFQIALASLATVFLNTMTRYYKIIWAILKFIRFFNDIIHE